MRPGGLCKGECLLHLILPQRDVFFSLKSLQEQVAGKIINSRFSFPSFSLFGGKQRPRNHTGASECVAAACVLSLRAGFQSLALLFLCVRQPLWSSAPPLPGSWQVACCGKCHSGLENPSVSCF